MREKRKRLLKFFFTWFVTIAIFVVLFSRIEFFGVLEVLKQADITLLSLGLLVSVLAHTLLSPARYRDILKVLGCRLSFSETFILRMGSLPIKGILPFKAGELARAAYLNKRHHLSYSKGLTSIVAGYVLSLCAMFFFVFIGWFLFYVNLPGAVYLALLFLALLPLVLLFRMHRLKPIITLFLYSLGFEGCKLFNTLLIFKGFNIEIPYSTFLIFAPITLIFSTLPVTFWGLGTRESAILLLFSSYTAPDRLLAGSLLISFVNRLFPVLLGLFFMKPFLNRLLAVNRRDCNEPH